MSKKNVLFILPFLPYPLKSGGHQAIFNGIKAFVDDINVFVIYEEGWNQDFSQDEANFIKALDNKVKVFKYKHSKQEQSFALRTYTKYWNFKEAIKSCFKKKKADLPPFSLQLKPRDLIMFANNIIEREHIDIVQCEMLETATYILSLPKQVRTIFVHHEIRFIRQIQELESRDLSEESRQIQKNNQENELFLLNKFDDIVTLSEQDSQILQSSCTHTKIHTSLATIESKQETNTAEVDCYKLSFVGPSFHLPNVIGINWFLENCWKDLKTNNSRYSLQIIGEWSEGEKKKILKKYPDVQFKGFVTDLVQTISNTVMLIPITIGSGIRMKILEAANIGCPVVSTSVGAMGLPLNNENSCLIGDSGPEFFKKIISLQDRNLTEKLIKLAKEKIQLEYSFEKLYASRIGLYQ